MEEGKLRAAVRDKVDHTFLSNEPDVAENCNT